MASFIEEAIQSILNNSFQDIEIIIIDDGSTDDTRQVIDRYMVSSDIPIQYHHVSHKGKSACINGIFKSLTIKGDYIIFMDADDELPELSLEDRYDAITSSDADLVIGAFSVTDLQGHLLEERNIEAQTDKEKLLGRFLFAPKTPFHLNGAIISKDLLLKTGPFDESLVRGQEVDYSIRLLQAADNIKILSKIVYHYRKYQRTTKERMKIRFQTIYYRFKWINKHADGLKKNRAVVLQFFYDVLKLGYEFFRRY